MNIDVTVRVEGATLHFTQDDVEGFNISRDVTEGPNGEKVLGRSHMTFRFKDGVHPEWAEEKEEVAVNG